MDNEIKERVPDFDTWEDIRQELATMTRRSKLYKLIKAELVKRGNWKNRPRGEYPKAISQVE
jgi:hypothetical protein